MYVYGTFGKRFLAFLVDQLIILLIIVGLALVGGFNILWSIFGLIFVIYSMIFVWHSGSTIGKKIFRLKVVNTNHQPMSFWRTILREGPAKLVSGIFNLGYLWVLIDKKRQGWHDKIAKTYVVQVDRGGNPISASSQVQVTARERFIFWLLFLLLGIPAGVGFILTPVYLFVGSPIKIAGIAMSPSYTNGQFYMTNKLVYRLASPQKGDVVILKNPQNKEQDLIKRVIGLPGDQVFIREGAVYINGQILQESYLPTGTVTGGGKFIPNDSTVTVPMGTYFVLGDNRSRSLDSRNWGFVPKQDIISKLSFCYWLCK